MSDFDAMADYLILRRPGLRALAAGNAYRGIQRDRPGGLDELCPDHPVTRANEWYTSVAPAGTLGVVTSLEQARALVDAYARWGYGDFEVVRVRTIAPASPRAPEPDGLLLGFDVGTLDRSLLRAADAPAATLNEAGLFADAADALAWLGSSAGSVIEVVLVHPLPSAADADTPVRAESEPASALRIL